MQFVGYGNMVLNYDLNMTQHPGLHNFQVCGRLYNEELTRS